MNDAIPPPLIPEKPYTLPKSVLLIWLIVVALTIYLAGSRHHFDAQVLAGISGKLVAKSLFALLLSWLAWRLSRRSDWVKSTVFLIVFLLYTADLLAGLSARRRAAVSPSLTRLQDQARRVQQAQMEEFNETGTLSPNTQAMSQIIATMKDGASHGTPLERKLLAGTADFIQKINNLEAQHTEASEQIDSSWILEPKTPRSLQEIDNLAPPVARFLEVNQKFLDIVTNSAAHLSSQLQSHGIPPPQIQAASRSFQRGFQTTSEFAKNSASRMPTTAEPFFTSSISTKPNTVIGNGTTNPNSPPSPTQSLAGAGMISSNKSTRSPKPNNKPKPNSSSSAPNPSPAPRDNLCLQSNPIPSSSPQDNQSLPQRPLGILPIALSRSLYAIKQVRAAGRHFGSK